MTESALEVVQLCKRYGSVTALNELSFAAPAAKVTAVLGPNGAGKTTALEICEGFRTADSGVVRVLGRDPRSEAAALRPRLGVMLQSGGMHPGASAATLLDHVASLYASPLNTAALSERLGLSGLGRTPVRRLSGGEQRRLAFALAIVGRPELVILDEPTTGLDPQARLAVWDVVRELTQAGVTIVLTTHLLEEAERVADHVVVIDGGTTVAEGTLPELIDAESASVLTVRTREPIAVNDLAAVVPTGVTVREVSPGHYLLTGEVGPDVTARVATWCTEHLVVASELSLRQRSLEDVFLDLTGRELRP